MEYLSKLLELLKGYISSTKKIAESDELSRYIYFSKYIRKDNSIRHAAFDPSTRDGGTSTFLTSGLSQTEKRGFAANIAGFRTDGREPKGAAELYVEAVMLAGLKADYDNKPERHVNIKGWPKDKEDFLEAKMELARNSKYNSYQ